MSTAEVADADAVGKALAVKAGEACSDGGGLLVDGREQEALDAALAAASLSDPGAAGLVAAVPGKEAVPASAVAPAPAEAASAEALTLTPEQDAAAQGAADSFVELYELAFLSRAVQQLEAACAESGLPIAAVAQKLRTRGIDLPQLQARAAEVGRGIAECASDDGWKLIQDGKLRLLYRHQAGSTVHSFKGCCELPAPMEQPLSMAREFDLVTSWNSYITNSPILRTYCDVDLLVYASVWLPWPFAERDVLISAVADDQLRDSGVVAVSFASPPETPPGVELPPKADGRVHIYFTPGSCMTMTPLPAPAGEPGAGERTRVAIVANIDTRVANVPEAIISFVLRVFAPFMYSTVLKVLHKSFDDPAEPLPQRMAAHEELYGRMRQRVADYLAGHPQ